MREKTPVDRKRQISNTGVTMGTASVGTRFI